jgi:cysteine desulfuration protein SufE
MDMRPNKFTELIHFFESLPENERRENLMLFAKKADKWIPDEEINYCIQDVRKDEHCTDEVGIFVNSTNDTISFRVSLGPKVQTLTRAIASILCEISEEEKIEKIQAIQKNDISRIIGQELVRLRSQTVYYILERMQEALVNLKEK